MLWFSRTGSTPKADLFIEGGAAASIKEAYYNLLDDTSSMLGDLRSGGKLPAVKSLGHTSETSAGGCYDAATKDDGISTPKLERTASNGRKPANDAPLSLSDLEMTVLQSLSDRGILGNDIFRSGAGRPQSTRGTPSTTSSLNASSGSYFPPGARSMSGTAGTPRGGAYIPPRLRSTPSTDGTTAGRRWSGVFPLGTGMSSPYGPRLDPGRPFLTPRASSTGR